MDGESNDKIRSRQVRTEALLGDYSVWTTTSLIRR